MNIDWTKAMLDATPHGASNRTAGQDGLKGGVAASHKMAETDARLIRMFMLWDRLTDASRTYDVPVALIAALASRESRAGAALDSNGEGNGGMAFGILQVDRRHHVQRGRPDPYSADHIKQAIGDIFARYRAEVLLRYGDNSAWTPSLILQGACVAYNSGIDNVQTPDPGRLDLGTTGNDYGQDVYARAQWFHEYMFVAQDPESPAPAPAPEPPTSDAVRQAARRTLAALEVRRSPGGDRWLDGILTFLNDADTLARAALDRPAIDVEAAALQCVGGLRDLGCLKDHVEDRHAAYVVAFHLRGRLDAILGGTEE